MLTPIIQVHQPRLYTKQLIPLRLKHPSSLDMQVPRQVTITLSNAKLASIIIIQETPSYN